MKKIRYYKAMHSGKKTWFAESLGEPLKIVLPCGTVLKLACEFKRGDGWNVTDTATGYIAQHKQIRNKNELAEYYKDMAILTALSRQIKQEYYQKAKADLEKYQSNLCERKAK